MPVKQLTAKELHRKMQQGEPLLLLDVRESHEYRQAHIAGSFLLPMPQLPRRLKELPKEQTIVIMCHHGIRSQQIADYLVRHDYEHVYNLRGGIDAWSLEVDASVPRY
jgi:rhodanese-related sulfurtransferase